MITIRLLLLALVSFGILSCASYSYDGNDGYDGYHAKKPSTFSPTPVYSVNDKGEVKRDRRMEQVSGRGCADNSTNCDRPFGW